MSEILFAKLDRTLPLALLPLRLETRYLPRRDPTHLCIRVFPDVIHADAHHRALTAREADAGQQYWRSIWGGVDELVVSEARAWLAGQSTPYRALWLATATRPLNIDAPGDAEPLFPTIEIDDVPRPVGAALLPGEWMVRLYDAGMQLAHTAFTSAVDQSLVMAPSLSAAGIDAVHPVTGKPLAAPLAFLAGQDLLWTVDFAQAEAVGMAIRIPIAQVPDPVGALLVLGARLVDDAVAEADLLDEQLSSHWYSRGLDVAPQGTPTNNTDAGRSGVSLSAPDVDELFEREGSAREVAPAARALLLAADPALLYRLPAADSLSLAVGRLRTNTLDRIAHAEWAEGTAAWAMNLAIGYATMGDYLADQFAAEDGQISIGEDAQTLRQWYADWVRGGAMLPTLRCGEQPYGLLPITHRPEGHLAATAFEAGYEDRLTQLRVIWSDALPIAALDPNATDARTDGTPAGDALIVADVLGAVPHPTGFQLRAATNHLADDTATFMSIGEQLETHAFGDNLLDPAHDSQVLAAWQDRRSRIFGLPDEDPPVLPPTLATQLNQVDSLAEDIADLLDGITYDRSAAQAMLALIDDELRPLLETYQEALDAVPPALSDWAQRGGLGNGDLVNLIGTTFDRSSVAAERLVTTDGDIAEIRDVIARALDALTRAEAAPTPPEERPALVGSPAPLLAHLVDLNHRSVPVDAIAPVRFALAALIGLIDRTDPVDAEVHLARLLRESLGLAMYRLDAWFTAVAAKRLAERRRAEPAGIQIGGYGWLLDLSRSDDPASQGFIHAPSLSHATTAAVLRSGWSAYGTSRGTTPLSVDLSSARVRGAQWILDAVRNGQDLSEQLGARFERYLHDARLDEWIETVRSAVLTAKGDGAAPSAIVDGLMVARAWIGVDTTDAEDALRADLLARTNGAPDVRTAWRTLAGDLDAVADLTMAQAVHALIQDNDAQATAALAITGGGDGNVPRIDVTATQRDAQLISHRVVAVFDGAARSARLDSVIHQAEPRLAGWLASVLPRPDRVLATVNDTDTISLADLGVTSVEAACLAASAPTQLHSRLGRVVAAAARIKASPATDVPFSVDLGSTIALGDGTVSIDEFGLVASALRDALGRTRPLRAADLVLPDVDSSTLPGVDADELASRAKTVEATLNTLIASVQRGDRIAGLVRSAAIGVSVAVRALEAGATDESILPVVAALSGRVTATVEEGGAARLMQLSGGAIPVLPCFTPMADPDRVASARTPERAAQVAAGGQSWLRQNGRVRADLGAMVEFLLLTEAATGHPTGAYGLAQLPHTGGAWAAVDRPPDGDDRLSIVALTAQASLAGDTRSMAGLLIDGWTEGIPRPTCQTGLAVHFDSPSARPPQSILLSVVDDERGFSADELCDQLLHTIELAKMRAVGPPDLPSIGQFFPGVFVAADTVVAGGGQ